MTTRKAALAALREALFEGLSQDLVFADDLSDEELEDVITALEDRGFTVREL